MAALPADTLRAYADDLALVSTDIRASAAVFGPILGEFALISGLGFNLRRTVFVPLGDEDTQTFRSELELLCPRAGEPPRSAGMRTTWASA